MMEIEATAGIEKGAEEIQSKRNWERYPVMLPMVEQAEKKSRDST
ncbi:MAG: hypothetical protein V2B20_11450 [Pseudomonadota bacterium]